MSENDLHKIHQHLVKEVESNGGRVDAIYFAPHLLQRIRSCANLIWVWPALLKSNFQTLNFKKASWLVTHIVIWYLRIEHKCLEYLLVNQLVTFQLIH